jgi:hypothetical protein
VTVGPESGELPIQTVYTSSGWDSYSYVFRARHTTAWLTVHNPGVEEDPACGPLVDAFAIKTLNPPHHEKGNHLIRSRRFCFNFYMAKQKVILREDWMNEQPCTQLVRRQHAEERRL